MSFVPEALLADLDGTLANTEPLHGRAWLTVLYRYNLRYDEAWFSQWIGKSDRRLAEWIVNEHHELGLTVDDLQNRKRTLFHAAASEQATLFDGVAERIQRICPQIPIAIVTNSGRDDAEHIFHATHIDRQAQIIVTADDVQHLKPAPEGYLQAARRLGFKPQHCVAIEDSPAGSKAATEAGCYVIGITHNDSLRQLQANELVAEPRLAFQRVLDMLD